MIHWLLRVFTRIVIGTPRAPEVVDMTATSATAINYGKVVCQPYINFGRDGRPYVKVTFKRMVGAGGERRSNSFHVNDLEDMQRCITRIRAWADDNGFLAH